MVRFVFLNISLAAGWRMGVIRVRGYECLRTLWEQEWEEVDGSEPH